MHVSLNRLRSLLESYLNGNCTEDEEMELMAMIRKGSHDEYIRNYIASWVEFNSESQEEILDSARSEEIFSRVLRSGEQAVVRPVFSWRRAAATVAVALGLSVGIYLLVPRNAATTTATIVATAPEKNDVSPGKTGAILTLADGRQLVLDSTEDGTIAMQGSTAIDIRNGVVSYEAGGEDDAVVYNTMTTPRGRKYRLLLADGTVIWLNSESSVTFPTSFPGNERLVMIKGEAYFEVARDVNKPFIVQIGDRQKISVLGTEFNINAYENEEIIRTTLITGSIQVEAGSSGAVVIKPGQQTVLTGQGAISTRNNANLEAVVAWKNGFFHFQNADIKDVMRQLSRWYDVEVDYPESLPDWSFTGEIGETLTLKEVLDGLAFTNIKFKIDGKKLTLLPQ